MPHSLFLIIKYMIIFYILVVHIKELNSMKELSIGFIIFGGITFLSTILNQNSFNKCVAAFIYAIHIIDIYLVVFSFIKRRCVDELIQTFIKTFMVFLFITEILMLFVDYDFSKASEHYFLGDKFRVSYLHCFVALLIGWYVLQNNQKEAICKKAFAFLYGVFSILVCARITCTTGILMNMLALIIYIPIPQKIKSLMANPKTLILSVGFVDLLIFGEFNLLTKPYVTRIVSDVLGKSTTWIGRINIYKMIVKVISQKIWIGYGYYSNVVQEIMGFGNPQNGVLKILVDSGVIGLAGYIILLYQSMREWKWLAKDTWPVIVFIYCMALASIVEINLTDYLFFCASAIIFSVGKMKKSSMRPIV